MFAILFLLAARQVACQGVARMNVPQRLCSGDSVIITIGYDTSDAIVLSHLPVALGHSERIFLPDGVPCETMECSYRSHITFNSFSPSDTISTAEDINYLRLKIEHSYIGDLYVNITCPNGQTADLLRFSNHGTSSCTSAIPESSRGWLSGNNMPASTKLGNAVGSYNRWYPCDSTNIDNRAGIGWNYCWSDNTTNGYEYASGDGIIYRAGHQHNSKVDSSKVATGENFYHPDESFAALTGCPLNGDWYIEVIDGYNLDNGYIFSWELSLNENLLTGCVCDSFLVQGNGVTRVDDTTFIIVIPEELGGEARWVYRVKAFDDCGNSLDTTFVVNVFPSPKTEVVQEVVENDLPVEYGGQTFDDDVENVQFRYTAANGCDSTVHYNLTVWRNVEYRYDTLVCETDLPLQWHGIDFESPGEEVVRLHTTHGADSTEHFVLRVARQDTIQEVRGICKGNGYAWIDGVTYYDTSEHPVLVFETDSLCDTVMRLTLTYPRVPFAAEMTIEPNPVTKSNLECTVADISESCGREWHIEDRTDTTRSVTFVFPIEHDSVEVELTAYDKYGCTDTVSRIVYLDKTAVWVPNVFTPDEGANKEFGVVSEGVLRGEVQVFDRTGLLVTSFDMLTGKWDGTKNGHPCRQGTYVWRLRYVSVTQRQIEKEAVGTVTLLR